MREEPELRFAVGGGFRLGLVLPLQLEGRYTWGLRDVGDVASGLDQRTRTFMLMVGRRQSAQTRGLVR